MWKMYLFGEGVHLEIEDQDGKEVVREEVLERVVWEV